jgi:two-component system, OmpR family, phosphate regulon sensor histidine kinase PhoR
VLVVRDCGFGIEAAKLPHIFDDYFRTAAAAPHNRASSGLGLAIVRQLVLAGRIGVRVQRTVGAGTRFTLRFAALRQIQRGDTASTE